MERLIRLNDAIDAIERTDWYHINPKGELVHGANSTDNIPLYKAEDVYQALKSVPAVEPKQGEWIDKAISIIDDMRSEGIVDYEQAREFRMRARMKGADDEHDK